jgi:hypothetical protein
LYLFRTQRRRQVRPWAFFVISHDRRAALRAACDLIDDAPPFD